MIITGKYPKLRMRRSRKTDWMRKLVRENSLSSNDFILPIFVTEGKNKKIPIKTMPEVFRYSVDKLGQIVDRALKLKIPMVAIFPQTNSGLKDSYGSEALNENNLVCKAIRKIKDKYKNEEHHLIEMDKIFNSFSQVLNNFDNEHGYANSRARLRMATLYQAAAANSGLVVGTGNKVEDFGVGFYTKYGDGGVDISPIADCTKTQVWELGKYLGVSQEIINSQPTDGLWDDGRNDVQQLGMSYEDLEKAMENKDDPNYQKYLKIREKNLHKMNPIPVCKFNE